MIRKILVALDGSPRAPAVFDGAAELGSALGASLVLYRALIVPPDYSPAGEGEGDPLPAYMKEEAHRQLVALTQRAPELSCELRIEQGTQPWRSILDAADAVSADLIVLGSHGYSGWDRVLGTVAGKVANVAQRSVFVVHNGAPAR